MVHLRAFLFCIPIVYSTGVDAQSFTQTIGGMGAQDGVGTMAVGTGYHVGVREFNGTGPHQGFVYSMSNTGGFSSSSPLGLAQTTFLQGLANASNGAAFLFGSVLDSTNGSHNALVVKLDDEGNVAWIHVDEEPGSQQYFAAVPLPDGGVVLCGVTSNTEGHDVLLARHDANGDRTWATVDPTLTDAEGQGVAIEGDDIVVTGRQTTFSGRSDVLFLRSDLNGNIVNTTSLGGAMDDVGRAIVGLGNGRFVIAGWTNSYGVFDASSQSHRKHVQLLCVDLDGDTLWTRAIGDTIQDHQAFAIQRASNGELLVAGESSSSGRSDAFFTRFNNEGGALWSRTLDIEKEDRLIHILPLADGGFVGTGWSFGPFGRQLLFIRRSAEGF